jgi:hypothetical protein
MLDYAYIFHFLNNHAIKMLNVPRGTKKWINETGKSAVELYNTLYDEEQIVLGNIEKRAANTYKLEIK